MNQQVGGARSIVSGSNTPSLLARSMFYCLESYGHWLCSAQYETVREGLRNILVLYTLSGEGQLLYRGSSYALTKGCVFVIDCTEAQEYRTVAGGEWEFLYLHLSGQESRQYVRHILQNGGPVYRCGEEEPIPKTMWEIVSLARLKEPHTDISVSVLLLHLLSEFLILSRAGKPADEGISEAVLDSIRYIEENCRQPLNLDMLSRHVSLSKSRLCHQFKKQTGSSPYEYYVNHKISQSKELLKYTELPVGEIGELLGFTDISHFIKTFTQRENITPLRYRKLYRG